SVNIPYGNFVQTAVSAKFTTRLTTCSSQRIVSKTNGVHSTSNHTDHAAGASTARQTRPMLRHDSEVAIMTLPQNCRCCGAPLHQLHYPEQTLTNSKGERRTFPARVQVECHNKSCQMWMQTLEASTYANKDLS